MLLLDSVVNKCRQTGYLLKQRHQKTTEDIRYFLTVHRCVATAQPVDEEALYIAWEDMIQRHRTTMTGWQCRRLITCLVVGLLSGVVLDQTRVDRTLRQRQQKLEMGFPVHDLGYYLNRTRSMAARDDTIIGEVVLTAIQAILRAIGKTEISCAQGSALANVLMRQPQHPPLLVVPWLRQLVDHVAVRNVCKMVCGGERLLFPILDTARRTPMFDPDGTYATHLHAVESTTMSQHRLLWLYPKSLALALERNNLGQGGRNHVIDIAEALVTGRITEHPDRLIPRIRRSVGGSVAHLVFHLSAVLPVIGGKDIESVLHRGTTSHSDVVRLVAVICANAFRRGRGRGSVQVLRPATLVDRWTGFMSGLIRVCFFQSIPSAHRITRQEVQRCMFLLETENPAQFTMQPVQRHQRSRNVPTTEDVQQLLMACQGDPCERLLIEFLCTGLRAEALGRLTVADVWDEQRSVARETLRVREKNSQERVIHPTAALRSAVTCLVGALSKSHQQISSWYIFPAQRTRTRYCKHTVALMLRRVCMRAGLPIFNPHIFRTWITNTIVNHGYSLEHAARFLGHRYCSTTYKHYWSPNDISTIILRQGTTSSTPFENVTGQPTTAMPTLSHNMTDEEDGLIPVDPFSTVHYTNTDGSCG